MICASVKRLFRIRLLLRRLSKLYIRTREVSGGRSDRTAHNPCPLALGHGRDPAGCVCGIEFSDLLADGARADLGRHLGADAPRIERIDAKGPAGTVDCGSVLPQRRSNIPLSLLHHGPAVVGLCPQCRLGGCLDRHARFACRLGGLEKTPRGKRLCADLVRYWHWRSDPAPTSAQLYGAERLVDFPINTVALFLGPPLGILLHIFVLRAWWLQKRSSDRLQSAVKPITA